MVDPVKNGILKVEFLILTGRNDGSQWKLQWAALKGSQMTRLLEY